MLPPSDLRRITHKFKIIVLPSKLPQSAEITIVSLCEASENEYGTIVLKLSYFVDNTAFSSRL